MQFMLYISTSILYDICAHNIEDAMQIEFFLQFSCSIETDEDIALDHLIQRPANDKKKQLADFY